MSTDITAPEDVEGIPDPDALPDPIDPDAGRQPDEPHGLEWAPGVEDPELVNWLQTKGFSDLGTALRSAREAEQRATRAEQEHREFIAGLAANVQGGDEDYEQDDIPQGDPFIFFRNVGAAIDSGEVDTGRAMYDAFQGHTQMLMQAVQAMIDDRLTEQVEPLISRQEQGDMQAVASRLASQFGPLWDEAKERTLEILGSDYDRYNNAAGIEEAFGRAVAEMGPERIAQLRRPPETLGGGARGGRRGGMSDAARIVAEMDALGSGADLL